MCLLVEVVAVALKSSLAYMSIHYGRLLHLSPSAAYRCLALGRFKACQGWVGGVSGVTVRSLAISGATRSKERVVGPYMPLN